MNRSIEQALLSLLPTHNSTLPQPLTELASSLLAQSRHRASTLKTQEEAARLYACAHIACERLKITLNLPPIDPRPPIQPRLYKRLYSHLEKILPASTSTPGRQTHSGRANASPAPPRATPAPTPSKGKTLAQMRGTPAKAAGPKLSSADALPPWMRPTLRLICNENGHGKIGPVVMSGLESIVSPDGVMTEDTWIRNNLVSLLGGLYLYVWRAVTWPRRALEEKEYIRFRKELAVGLNTAPQKVIVKLHTTTTTTTSSSVTPSKRKKPGSEPEGPSWEGWRAITITELNEATTYINRHGWLELNWAKGIEDLVAEALKGDQGEMVEWADEENDIEPSSQELLHGRHDTMLQPRYNYLSQRNLDEYEVWKQGILSRIKELEGAPPPPPEDLAETHSITIFNPPSQSNNTNTAAARSQAP